jgi:hypothetical protein
VLLLPLKLLPVTNVNIVTGLVTPSTTITTVQVVLTSDPSAIVATTKCKIRRLQAVPNSVTVAYDVRNLPDDREAAALQQRLTSAEGSTSLLNSYRALPDTAATAANSSTVAINGPSVPPTHTTTTSAPVGIIADCLAGGIALVAIAVLAVWCKKRRAATRRHAPLRKAVDDDTALLYSSSSSSSKMSINGGSFNTSGITTTTTAAAPHPLRHSSAHRFGSMLQAMDSDNTAPEHNATTASVIDAEQGDNSKSSVDSSGGIHNSTSGNRARAVVQAPAATVTDNTIQQQQSAPTSASSTATTCRNTSGAGSGAVRFTAAPVVAVSAATADNTTDTRGATGVNTKQSQLATTKQGWTRRLSTHMTSAARRGVREHGEKAVIAWEGIGSGNNIALDCS